MRRVSDLRTPDAESPGEAMLAALLTRSHSLHPDDVPNAVADAAAMIGASDVIVYMIDYDQHLLVPLPRRGEDRDPDALEALDVDATIGGRAYRSVEVHDTAVDGGRRLWVPVLDGAERMGVLALTVEERTPLCERRCRLLASLVGELLVTKAAYGDTLELAKRRQPMELAAELRWSVLPPLTFSGDRVEITGILQPAYQIAGDSFDYALNGDLVHFAVIDAMGHGLEASRIANLAMGSYRHSRRLGLDLLGTLRAMDLVIADEFGSEKFVTGQLGTLDMTTGELHWLTAGHPRPLTGPARNAAGNPATRVSNACWSPATRSSPPFPVSPRPAAAVASS